MFFGNKSPLGSTCCSNHKVSASLDFETTLNEDAYILRNSYSQLIGNATILDVFVDGVRKDTSMYTYDSNTSTLILINQSTAGIAVHINYEG